MPWRASIAATSIPTRPTSATASARPIGRTASAAGDDAGTIALWAWGFHRVVDYLTTDGKDRVDPKRIAVVGHSRNGKTALLAGAFDERIALVIPLQAGCGGTAPSRTADTRAESVKRINTSFPHWFCDNFQLFNDQTERLPFDQHCLIALCAPRPVLLPNAEEDLWANPSGQFELLRAASPVYQLLGAEGLPADAKPEMNKLQGLAPRLFHPPRQARHDASGLGGVPGVRGQVFQVARTKPGQWCQPKEPRSLNRPFSGGSKRARFDAVFAADVVASRFCEIT